MRSRLFALGCVAFGLVSSPVMAKHHQGEPAEVEHHRRGGAVAPSVVKVPDDKGKHAEPGDDRGNGGKGKDDKAPHH